MASTLVGRVHQIRTVRVAKARGSMLGNVGVPEPYMYHGVIEYEGGKKARFKSNARRVLKKGDRVRFTLRSPKFVKDGSMRRIN
jgi:hypothetical protein